ncbi:Fic family protein [Rhodococcus qingshengii]|uniref:Fic family protein n=1 Tax=Rhodococcus qingshengii TaxID=334542 RepID=UPI0036DC7CBC
MSANDAEPYRPIMPLTEWAETKLDTSQLDIDHAHFNYYFNKLDSPGQNALIRQVLRESAAESGALEDLYTLKAGESRTIATEAEGWESILGDDVEGERRSFEDLVEALEHATRSVDDDRPITLTLIREIHELACKSQLTFEAMASINGSPRRVAKKLHHGQFKTETNFVRTRSGTIHAYCPPESVQAEMNKFCDEIQSESFKHVHTVTRAAYVHYCLSQIHPFEDGNGRICRIVASMYLMQTYKVPLVVYADRKQTYLQALEAVENQDYKQLTQNIADRIAATLAELSQIIKSRRSPSAKDQLSNLMKLVNEHADVKLANIDEIIERVKLEFTEEVRNQLLQIAANSNGTIRLPEVKDKPNLFKLPTSNQYRLHGKHTTEDGTDLPYDHLNYHFQESQIRKIFLHTDDIPTDIVGSARFSVGRARETSEHFPLAIIASRDDYREEDSRIGYIRLRIEDCFPTTGTNTLVRMKTLAESMCAEMLRQITEEAEKRLRQSGSFLGNSPN